MTQGDLICIRCGQRGHVLAQCKQPIIEGPVSMLTVLVPIRIESEANRREHYYKVHDRKRAHAHAVGWVMKQHKPPVIAEDGQLVIEQDADDGTASVVLSKTECKVLFAQFGVWAGLLSEA